VRFPTCPERYHPAEAESSKGNRNTWFARPPERDKADCGRTQIDARKGERRIRNCTCGEKMHKSRTSLLTTKLTASATKKRCVVPRDRSRGLGIAPHRGHARAWYRCTGEDCTRGKRAVKTVMYSANPHGDGGRLLRQREARPTQIRNGCHPRRGALKQFRGSPSL